VSERFLKAGVAAASREPNGEDVPMGPSEETAMTTTDLRSELAETTASAGWHRRVDDRVDVYLRGLTRVRVIWRGDDAISGGSRYQDDSLEAYSRDLATVKGWLAK
jgi:hypothetical protein